VVFCHAMTDWSEPTFEDLISSFEAEKKRFSLGTLPKKLPPLIMSRLLYDQIVSLDPTVGSSGGPFTFPHE
jgi:hypothetical protein